MDILIYGAGAVGGYLGARLTQQKHNVTLITRDVMAKLIGETGLEVTENGKRVITRPTAVTSVAQAFKAGQQYDLIILAMKAYDIARSIDPLIAFCPEPNMLLTTQNGIGVEKGLIKQFGAERVLAGSFTLPIRKETTTQLVAERSDGGICLAPTQPKQDIKQWLNLFKEAGLDAQSYKSYESMKWSKAFLNIIANATSAILNRRPGLIYRSDAIFDLEIRMLQETLAVMKAAGHKVVDLPAVPASKLAFSIKRLPRALLKPGLTKLVADGRGDKMPSFHIDLTVGKGKSEVVYHNGAIAKAGKELGVPTPINAALTDILWKLTLEKLDWREFNGKPSRLVQEVKRYELALGGKK
ncbi:MAG: ketopantoate reductase family protein [Ardenticatenaceae bacterium]|nr:ketopantoate reductase family protein [Anaerolineales bacterium]MCB8938574.1 ketopantoate reductase family protein [Ardenticatenaceae bacterium]MCB8973707.1 ketopantoate reductase family protein [Ardenticatenaceae bacterium]